METMSISKFESAGLLALRDLGVHCRFKMGMAQRIRHLIENRDWDERILKFEKTINNFCWAVLFAGAISLLPVCLKLFF